MFKRSTLLSTSLIALTIAIASSSTARAADLDVPPPPPPPEIRPAVHDWSGGYVGGHVGGACMQTYYIVVNGGDPDLNGCGFNGGLFGGWNQQFGSFVVGAEGDWSWASGRSARNLADAARYDIDWISTMRGRLGWLSNNDTMFYVTGGGAWMRGKLTDTNTGGNDTKTHSGFVIGGGIEHAFTSNFHARLEYLYAGLNKKRYDVGVACGTCIVDQYFDDLHMIRAGFSWNFGYGIYGSSW